MEVAVYIKLYEYGHERILYFRSVPHLHKLWLQGFRGYLYMDTETLTFKDIGIMRPSGVICLHIFYRANTLVKTIFIIKNIYGQYNINTKHESRNL
jgi:hypothetical protein